jgi:FixJ family two-component response regulator
MEKQRVIVLIDDDILVLQALKDQLSPLWYDIIFESCQSGEEALELIAQLTEEGMDVAAVISDHIMDGMTGAELLVELQRIVPRARKIMLTGQADLNALSMAVNRGALYRYITKPWDATDMQLTLMEALRAYDTDNNLDIRNKELKELNASLERQVLERTQELIEKNKELEEGITYASHVQQTLFPTLNEIARDIVVSESYLRPYDQVSGDFYWLSDTQGGQNIYLAVGDCTGHGIAGGFISVMHIAALNEAMFRCEDRSPRGILNYMKRRISDLTHSNFRVSNLHLQSETTILCIDALSGIIRFASDTKGLIMQNLATGALSEPLRELNQGLEKDGSRKVIEGEIAVDVPYRLYIYTDGITDQFGEENGKKLKGSGLKQWIQQRQPDKEPFTDFFQQFTGAVHPTDDATMVILDVKKSNITIP